MGKNNSKENKAVRGTERNIGHKSSSPKAWVKNQVSKTLQNTSMLGTILIWGWGSEHIPEGRNCYREGHISDRRDSLINGTLIGLTQ